MRVTPGSIRVLTDEHDWGLFEDAVQFGSVRAAPSDEEEAAVVDAWLRLPPSVDGMREEEVLQESEGQERVTDKSFPPNDSSLYRDPSAPPADAPLSVEWASLSGSLYVHSAHSGDLKPGLLHDRWFLGALSIVASRQDLLMDLIVSDDLGQAGLFTFRFYKNGQWHDLVVDDLLPCSPGSAEPLFSVSSQEGELWPSLMEKAYAKLHGCYYALAGGNTTEALVDLTGGAGMKMKLTDPKYEEEALTGALWDRLQRYVEWGYLLGCAYSPRQDGNLDPHAVEPDAPDGILWWYAYSIIDVQVTSIGHKLLKLRNPWGGKEWRGPWAHGSREWEEYEELKEEVEYEETHDGTFWMEYQDFVRCFNKIHVCRLFPPSWHQLTIKGAWVGKTAGGAPTQKGRTSGTWCNNPQYHLTVAQPCQMVISLMQRDSRVAFGQRLTKEERHLALGMVVVKVPRDFRGRKWSLADADVVRRCELTTCREISVSVDLHPDFSYIVVPFTSMPEQEGPFILRTFSSAPVEVERPPPAHELQVQGRWTQRSAGGRQPSPTFGSNPQFVLEVPRKTTAMFILERTDTGDKVGVMEPEIDDTHAIGLALVQPERDPDGGVCRRLVVDAPADVYGETAFDAMQEAILLVTLMPETPYVIVPSLAAPGSQAPFQLTAYSSTDMVLSAFRDTATVTLPGAWEEATCGGCDLHDSWKSNPRFVLSVAETGVFRIALSEPGKRWKRNAPLDKMIGFYVLQAEREDGNVPIEKKACLVETPFMPMNEVVEELELQYEPGCVYVIVPCTYAPGKQADFRLSVTAEVPFNLEEKFFDDA